MKATYKSIVEFARQSASVKVEYRALGGTGISAAGEAAKITDPTDLGKLAQIISEVAADFTQDNSSITGYVLQSNTSLGAPEAPFDPERIKQVGAITRALLRANEASARLEAVRTKAPAAYTTYFLAEHQQLDALRAALIEKAKTCASGGSCEQVSGDILDQFAFLEDMFTNAKLTLSCQYQKASDLMPVAGARISNPQILEAMTINLVGDLHHKTLIDFEGLKLYRLTPKLHNEDITSRFSGLQFTRPNAGRPMKAYGSIFSTNLRPREVLTFDRTNRRYLVDTIALASRREDVLGSAYALSAPGPGGYKISYTAGFPPREDCPLVRVSGSVE